MLWFTLSGLFFMIQGICCDPQTLLLISLDGFRWDFASKAKTPNLDMLVKTGVTVPYVRSVFPTVTYAGHHSIVTGLYPESHGIVSNTMYDPVLKEWFGASQTDPRWWNAAEPIWVTNQRHKGRSGLLYWLGERVKIKGMYPKYKIDSASPHIDFTNSTGKVMSFEKRVEKLISWLTGPKPPNFVAAYFEEPDKTCHHKGWPDLPLAIQRVDKTIGLVVQGLKKHHLFDKVNIMVTADHGMANTSCDKVIDLDKYVNPDNFEFWDSWFNMMLAPKAGKAEEVYERLKNVPHLHVYHKKDVPMDLHCRNNQRISPLVLIPSEGWLVSSKKGRLIKISKDMHWVELNHGISCKCKSMSTSFIAHGPAFKVNFTGKPFESVSIYPLMCKILGIPPQRNNGSLDETRDLLRPKMLSNNNIKM